jgi:Flp pilus assembly protein TadD
MRKSRDGAALEKVEHVEKAESEFSMGNYEVALYEYVRALILDPKDADLYYKVGVLQAAKGNLQLADSALRRATELKPDFVAALDQYGQLNLRLRRHDAAAKMFRRAIDADRTRVVNAQGGSGDGVDLESPFQSYNGMGVIEDMRGNFDAAQQYYIVAQRIRPNSPELVNNMGYSLYLNGQIAPAEAMFRQVMQIDPTFSKAWYNLALVYVRRGQQQEALALLTERTGDAASANNTVGYLSMLEGRREQAERLFTQAIELSPTYFELAYQNRERNRLRQVSGDAPL